MYSCEIIKIGFISHSFFFHHKSVWNLFDLLLLYFFPSPIVSKPNLINIHILFLINQYSFLMLGYNLMQTILNKCSPVTIYSVQLPSFQDQMDNF